MIERRKCIWILAKQGLAETDQGRAEFLGRAMASVVGAPKNSDRYLAVPKAIYVVVMGVGIVRLESYTLAVKYVEKSIISRKKLSRVVIWPQKRHRATRDRRPGSLLTSPVAGICDGAGVSAASRALHNRALPRYTGCDLFFRLVAATERKNLKLLMLGAGPESNEKAYVKSKQRRPVLQILGHMDRYSEDSGEVVEQINAGRAYLLLVATGTVKQEDWIAEHREATAGTIGTIAMSLRSYTDESPYEMFRRSACHSIQRFHGSHQQQEGLSASSRRRPSCMWRCSGRPEPYDFR